MLIGQPPTAGTKNPGKREYLWLFWAGTRAPGTCLTAGYLSGTNPTSGLPSINKSRVTGCLGHNSSILRGMNEELVLPRVLTSRVSLASTRVIGTRVTFLILLIATIESSHGRGGTPVFTGVFEFFCFFLSAGGWGKIKL